MFKPMNAKNANRILAVLVAILLLPGLSIFPGTVATDPGTDYEASGLSVSRLYDGVPNGTITRDGRVLIHYGLWDPEAMLANAVETDRYLDVGQLHP